MQGKYPTWTIQGNTFLMMDFVVKHNSQWRKRNYEDSLGNGEQTGKNSALNLHSWLGYKISDKTWWPTESKQIPSIVRVQMSYYSNMLNAELGLNRGLHQPGILHFHGWWRWKMNSVGLWKNAIGGIAYLSWAASLRKLILNLPNASSWNLVM